MDQAITLRPATIADLPLLRHWDEQPHVVASNTRAHRFYERLGFRFAEERRFGEDDTFVYRLSRESFAG